MQALEFSSGTLAYRTDLPIPTIKQGEALIKIIAAGICSTDLEIVKGYADFEGILGHEFVGLVQDAYDKSWVGKRVVGSINIGCNSCAVCLFEGPEHCAERTVLGIHGQDGVFAEYVTLPIDNLYEVPPSISDEQAVFTEPLAAALRILEQVVISPSQPSAVIGPGRLGMLIAQVLALSGSDLIVLGRSQTSLEMAIELGLRTDLVDQALDNSFNLIVEATGNEAGLAQALRLVRPKGTLILKSTFSANPHIDLTKLVVGEVKVFGSRCGPFSPALRLIERGLINFDEMIDASFKLSDGLQAIKFAAQPGIRKVLLRPSL